MRCSVAILHTIVLRGLGVLVGLGVLGASAASAGAEETKFVATPRLLHVPSADLQEGGHFFLTAGSTHRGAPFVGVALGLGDIAEVDVEANNTLATCASCAGGGSDEAAHPFLTATAQFKVGISEGRLVPWQPALAVGLRTQIGTRSVALGDRNLGLRAARLYLAASKRVGPVGIHGGVDVWDGLVQLDDTSLFLHDGAASAQLRPFAGLVWRPSIYPKTMLLADVSYAPLFAEESVALGWLVGLGVRYQAFSWSSVELAVRNRQDDSLGDSTVFVRLNLHR